MESQRTILVCGATGRQGGATVRHLLQGNWKVRALTRNIDSPSARQLKQLGAQVVPGDMENSRSVEQAMNGCEGVFSVQNFWECGPDGEVRQGKQVADIAGQLDVDHFVYSSVGGANRSTGIPHFDSKWEIEQHIQRLGLPATVIRPVFFYDNFNEEAIRSSILQGRLALPMEPTKPLQMVATEDIGGLAAMAFERPREFIGKAIELAGDEMTMPDVAGVFTKVLGRPVRFDPVDLEEVERTSPESAIMFRWFNEQGYQADLVSLRDMYPQLQTFETWLRRTSYGQVPRTKVA